MSKPPDDPRPSNTYGHTDKCPALVPLLASIIIMTAFGAAISLLPTVCKSVFPPLPHGLAAAAVRVVFVLVLICVCRKCFARWDSPQGEAEYSARFEGRSRCSAIALCILCGVLLQLSLAAAIALICGAERIGVTAMPSDITSFAAFFSAAMITPICEEAVFRGAAYRTARLSVGALPAAILTSAAFALIHRGTAAIITAFICGLILAALSERSTSIRGAIALHSAFNLMSFFAGYLPLSPAVCAAIFVPLASACVIFTIRKGTTQ